MIFFHFSKNAGFWLFLVHPTVVSVLLSACFVSRMRDYFLLRPMSILPSLMLHMVSENGMEEVASQSHWSSGDSCCMLVWFIVILIVGLI